MAILTAILNNILPALFKYLITKKHYLVLLIALFVLVGGIFAVSSYFYDNSYFQKNDQFNKINKALIDEIKPCKNGFMATIGTVSIEEDIDKNKNIWHEGRFMSSVAVDNEQTMNLMTYDSIYYNNYKVDPMTYNLFSDLGKSSFSAKFDLKDNFDSLKNYPTLYKFIEKTEWGQNGNIDTLYLTAVTTDFPLLGTKVIFIISFTTNKKFYTKSGCEEIKDKLRIFKDTTFNKEIKSL